MIPRGMAQTKDARMSATELIKNMAPALEPQVIAWRRFFHQYPEASGEEIFTSAALCAELEKMGVEYTRLPTTSLLAGAGIIATIKGTAPDAYDAAGNPKHRVALRADIDGLPAIEQTGVPFTSQNAGVMHACGHDCHMAMMLGAIQLLRHMTDELHGEARILFQPSEENSLGSRYMIENGALDGVEAIYGAHIWSEVPAGKISCEAGQRMANCDWFEIDVQGESAHGSMPHLGKDAIVIGSEIVNSLQVLVSRDVSPFDPVVITVGKFTGGEARNIIAGSVNMEGTIRTWSNESRDDVPRRMERIVEEVADSFGAQAKLTYLRGNPGLSNDAKVAEIARRAVVESLGEEAVGSYRGTLSGEDFSEYLKIVPGVFVFVGTRNPEIGATHPQHSCYYSVDESVLVKGSMVAAQWAADMLV
jgi:amidohydrolase